MAHLVALMTDFKAGTASAPVTAEHVSLFMGSAQRPGLLDWPPALVFPALDMLRLVLLAPSAAPLISGSLIDRLVALLQPSAAGDPPDKAVSLMVMRAFANLAYGPKTRKLLAGAASAVLDTLATPLESGSTGLRLAAGTVLLNMSSLLKDTSALAAQTALSADATQLQALSLCAHTFSVPALLQPTEEETLYRVLVALSTLLSLAATTHATALDLDMPATLRALELPPTAATKVTAQREALLATLGSPWSKH